MDVSEFEEGCAFLSLDEEDSGGLEAPSHAYASASITYFELVGRFLTDRTIKIEHMQQTMASVWKPVMGVRIVPLNDCLFVFQFPHQRDM